MNEARLTTVRGRSVFTIQYEVARRFPFRDHLGRLWVVPCGFVTDGASFPWWLKYVGSAVMLLLLAAGYDGWTAFWCSVAAQSLIGAPIHRAYADAAVAHDYLYWIGARRSFADCVFFRLIVRRAVELRALSVHRLRWWRFGFDLLAADLVFAYRWLRAVVMYVGVAIGGWPAYLAHRRRRRAQNAEAL